MTALAGVRVFDLTRVLAGPLCTQTLGDMGADILKIEQPVVGDMTRGWGPPFDPKTKQSTYYQSCNRNKRSLSLDITQPEGLEVAKDLLKTCDVLVENFKVGFMERCGLGYKEVKKIKPDIIYCSITGFGQTGPYAPRPGYDFQIQGLSGLMNLIGEPEGVPLRAGISIADISTGIYSALAIVSALYQRSQTGEGQVIDMALLDSTLALMCFATQSTLVEGVSPPRVGNGHPNIVPYGAFPAQDGFVILAIGTDGQFEKFCQFVGREDLLTHPHFQHNANRVKHRDEVITELTKIIQTRPVSYWTENLEPIGVPSSPVNTLEQALQNPQVQARKIAEEFDNGEKTVASPLRLSASPALYKRPPPTLGQHTDEILREFLAPERIAGLKDKGIA